MQSLHDFTATLQIGIVTECDDAKHAVRVRLPALEDMPSDWLPVVVANAGGNRFYALPDPGEQVVCMLDARGEGGVQRIAHAGRVGQGMRGHAGAFDCQRLAGGGTQAIQAGDRCTGR